jgi:hypothetical protein
MKDFVSSHWIGVIAVVAGMSVGYAAFVPPGFPWAGLMWLSLASSATLFVALRSTHSITQVIREVDTEPRLAVVVAEPVAMPKGAARLQMKREGTL